MENIKLTNKLVEDFVTSEQINGFQSKLDSIQLAIKEKRTAGNDFLGWVELPTQIDEAILTDIEQTSAKLVEISDYVVVTGIGGSYLGARAVIESLKNSFGDFKPTGTKILYAGHNLSEEYLGELIDFLGDKSFSVIVISKSGTTTEPAVAFRILKAMLEQKYGDQANQRIVAITDQARGALKELATANGYKTYVVPDDVGGRYSVLTPVGLLPIAVAGFDIRKIVDGAVTMFNITSVSSSIAENPAANYAATRNALLANGFNIEIMVNYNPKLTFFAEWWKQLYGESEGKDGKGIFPASVNFTTDLHSMGQYIQDGRRELFETVISIGKSKGNITIPSDPNDKDGLNYIAGKNVEYVNLMAEKGTSLAHVDGGVPVLNIYLPELSEFYLGQLIYFFEIGCAYSGLILEVNPFDQPGVEAYKKNMFALLGKKGFEAQGEELRKRL